MFALRRVSAAAAAGCAGRRAVSTRASKRLQSFDPSGSVWVEFSPLAMATGAVNLGQGFPNIPLPPFVVDALADAAHAPVEQHQYARSRGHLPLAEQVAIEYSPKMGREIDPDSEVTTAAGASALIYAAMQAFTNPGDTCIVMEPMYDSYTACMALADVKPAYVPLTYEPAAAALTADGSGAPMQCASGYRLDMEALEAAMTPQTRMMVLNTPHNPTGKVFTRSELDDIAYLVRKHDDLIVLADEVYDSIVYSDAPEHVAFASLPGMAERTLTIGSAGKTFGVTGWRLGWALGPPDLITALWVQSQYITFAVTTPIQQAVADIFAEARGNGYHADAVAALESKRNELAQALHAAGMNPIVPQGSYFTMADTSGMDGPFPFQPIDGVPLGSSTSRDYQISRWLTQSVGVAAIPPSAFYSPANAQLAEDTVRLCFCKSDETLTEAIKRLGHISS